MSDYALPLWRSIGGCETDDSFRRHLREVTGADTREGSWLNKGSSAVHFPANSYIQEAKSHIALGDAASALRALDRVRMLEPDCTKLEVATNNAKRLQHLVDEGVTAYEKKDFQEVVYCTNRALALAVSCPHLKVLNAECLALLGHQKAQKSIDLLTMDPMTAICLQRMCSYYEDNLDKAFAHFQEVLRLAPDHEKTKETCRINKPNQAIGSVSVPLDHGERPIGPEDVVTKDEVTSGPDCVFCSQQVRSNLDFQFCESHIKNMLELIFTGTPTPDLRDLIKIIEKLEYDAPILVMVKNIEWTTRHDEPHFQRIWTIIRQLANRIATITEFDPVFFFLNS